MVDSSEGSWALLGEAIIAFSRRPSRRRLGALPAGIRRVPGPQIILVENFVDSPVGPFTVLTLAEPAMSGLRLGWHATTTVVNNGDARRVMRQRWGFPVELGVLRWSSDAGHRNLYWDEREIHVAADVRGRPMPFTLPLRMLQRRSDGPVTIPTRLKALVRFTKVECSLPLDDPLAAMNGRHLGLTLANLVVRRAPARRRRGMGGLRAPARAPEPGLAGMRDQGARVQSEAAKRLRWRSPSGV